MIIVRLAIFAPSPWLAAVRSDRVQVSACPTMGQLQCQLSQLWVVLSRYGSARAGCRVIAPGDLAHEKLLHLAYYIDERVDLMLCVVKIEACTCCGFDTELV